MHTQSRVMTLFMLSVLVMAATCFMTVAQAADEYYSGERLFELRPKSNAPRFFGHIGPTGILARIEKGVKLLQFFFHVF